MTPVQIAYFKHFLFDKGIERIYITLYKSNRLKGSPSGDKSANPESIEQFFITKPASDVLMKAFYFQINSDYGYDYWDNINSQWKDYWDMHKSNFSNTKYVTLKGTFTILRQNWDNKKYWEMDTKENTYKRLGIEPPPMPEDEKEEVPLEDSTPSIATSENTDSSNASLEGFVLVDTTYSKNGVRLDNNEVTVNLRNNGYRITFSGKVSAELRKHCYEYVKLLTNKDTGEIAFVFNHNSGNGVTIKNRETTRNVVINSKNIIEHLHSFWNLKKSNDFYKLSIIDSVYNDNCTIFKLKYNS